MKTTFLKPALGFCLIQATTSCSTAQVSNTPELNSPRSAKPVSTASAVAMPSRDQLFDSDWRFLRADAPGADNPAFDDSKWRSLDLPHDWSIEDLTPRTSSVPELAAVAGEWNFQKGDNPDWKARELDDSSWQKVKLPDIWEHHSNYTENNVYGWFRRKIVVPANLKGKDFDLLMGRIDDVDETYFNGVRIGGTGSFPPNYQWADTVDRRYRVPAALVRGDGTDVISVRVFDGNNNGGIYDAGQKITRIGPFAPQESENLDKTGYVLGGVGWYRKTFASNETNKRVAVRFDGVYMNADVWINGRSLGTHPHGYTSFEFDLTPFLKPRGQKNILAVRVRNEGKNSRWYSGSGIYRHVWLTTTNAVHVPTWGVFVSTPQVSRERATVKVTGEVRNDGASDAKAIVRVRVLDAAGKVVQTAQSPLQVPRGETRSLEQSIEVTSPRLWSSDAPNLYSAQVEVVAGGKTSDVTTTRFGIRTIEVDAARGFRLNGQPMKLKGGCIHHDNGPLGAAAIDRAEERRVQLLKAQGFNAVRSTHNPPSPAFLEACDRLGMLVIDEAFDMWNEQKLDNAQDYHRDFNEWADRDIASMVRRDRNHPSVVMWSIGNEIPEQFHAEDTQKRLRDDVLGHDPTRQITQAISTDWGNVVRNWDTLSDPAFKYLDVGGYNYLPQFYEGDHARHADRVMMATETYAKDAFDYWSAVEKHPYLIGDFVWTAMDYFGESGIGHSILSNEQSNGLFMSWPWYNAWCGDLDVCGFPKPQSLYRDVIWRRTPLTMAVHAPIPAGLTENVSWWGFPNVLPSWNWRGQENVPLQVTVYSRCERVRLELNGRVIGEKPVSDATKLTATFDVPYAPGELRAIGLDGGKVVAQTVLKTSGAPKKLKLTADRTKIRADRNDLSYVTVEVVDDRGEVVPDAKIPVRFSVSGAGELAAQGSGTPNEPASFRAPERATFRGRALAILRPKGKAGTITLRAQTDGFAPTNITVQTQ